MAFFFPRDRRQAQRGGPGQAKTKTKRRASRAAHVVETLESRTLLAFTGNVVGTVANWTGDGLGNNLVIDQNGAGLLRHNFQVGFNSLIDFDSFVAGDQTVPANAAGAFNVFINAGAADTVQFGSASAGADQLGGAAMTLQNIGGDLGDTLAVVFSNNAVNVTSTGSVLTGTGGTNVTWTTAAPRIVNMTFGTSTDTVNIQATRINLFGPEVTSIQGTSGLDTVNVGNAGSVQNILATLNVANTVSFTTLNLNNQSDAVPRVTTVTNSQVTGLAPAPINYVPSDVSNLTIRTGTGAGDTVNVLGTNGATLNLIGNGGSLVNLGNAGNAQSIGGTVNISNTGGLTGIDINNSLDPIARTTTITNNQVTGIAPATINYANASSLTVRTGNAGAPGNVVNVLSTGVTTSVVGNGVGTVNVGNAGNTQGILGTLNISNPPSFFDIFINDQNDAVGRVITVTNSSVTGIAPAVINYVAADTSSLTINAGTGNDTYNINSVDSTATNSNTFNGGPGNDTFNMNAAGFGPASSNFFNGDAGNDTFNVNFPPGVVLTATTFAINGGAATTRDVVNVNVNSVGDGPRAVTANYTATGVTVGGLGAPITSVNVEQANLRGDAANDDTMTVVGIAGAVDDIISVTPLTASSANVFLGGNPNVLLPPGTPASNNPGIAGGGTSPDLNLSGLATFNGLTVNGGAAGAGGNQLIVNGSTENINGVGGTSAWGGNAFGSTNQAIRAAGQAFDQILVMDSLVNIINNAVGQLVRVNVVTNSFGRVNPLEPDLVVNAGEESAANLPFSGIADDLTVSLSPVYRFQINGGDPPPATAPNGDRLALAAPIMNIWADKAVPPNVTFQGAGFGQNLLPVGTNSIERLDVNAPTVNFWGDNNTPGVDQQDYVRIVGTGPNAFLGSINSSSNINFNGVSFLNVFGYGMPPINPNSVTAVDTLELTPYADNTPQGWGVATSFDEGLPQNDGVPADLLILNGIANVSEDVVVRPSALQAGQVVITQGLTGVPIAIINFVANTDIVFQNYNQAGQSDTDTLALLGSLAQQPGVAIDQDVIANFGAAGNAANPKIIVNNPGAVPFYHVQNFTNFSSLTIDMGLGNDSLAIGGTAGADLYSLVGTGLNSGRLDVDLAGFPPVLVHVGSIEDIDLAAGAGGDVLNLFGTGGNDVFTMTDGSARANSGPQVNFSGAMTINVEAEGGADTVNHAGGAAYNLNAAGTPVLTYGTITTNLLAVERFTIDATAGAASLAVVGTSNDDAFNVALTGPSQAALTTQLGGLSVLATRFAGYSLQGGAGTNSLAVVGTAANDTGSYNGANVTVGGVVTTIDAAIFGVSVDLAGGPNNIFTLVGTAGNDTFSSFVGTSDQHAIVDVSLSGLPFRRLQLAQVAQVPITSGGGADTLNMNGVAGNNHFYMSELLNQVQANNGPFFGFVGMTTVRLFGGGFANDTVDYEANSPLYTVTPGFTPNMVVGGLTVDLPGIEYLNLFGPIGAGQVNVIGTSNDDAYAIALTGPTDASLSANFNQPNLFALKAVNFANYGVTGGAGGVDSVAITGTTGDDLATYDGLVASVNGVNVDVSQGIDSLAIALLAGNNQLTLNGSAVADTFTVFPTSNQFDSDVIASIAGATGPQNVALKSAQNLVINGGGGADVLSVVGTLANNTFAQTDTTIRVDSGPVITTDVVGLFVFGGGGTDNVVYSNAALANYVLDASGASPTLTAGPVLTTYSSVEAFSIDSTAAGALLAVIGTVNDEFFNVSVSGVNQASLTVGLNSMAVSATRFNNYDLQGNQGVDSVTINATNGADPASYDGNVVTVASGVSVNVALGIEALTVNMLDGADAFQLIGSAGDDSFTVVSLDGLFDSNLIVAIAGATGPQVVKVTSTEDIGLTGNGGADVLNMVGTLANNTFAQTDTTIRMDSGPLVTYGTVQTLNVLGSGGTDNVVYTGGVGTTYGLDASGVNPVLTALGTTTTYSSVEDLDLTGGGPGAALNVIGTPLNDSFHVAIPFGGTASVHVQLGGMHFAASAFGNVLLDGNGGVNQVSVTGTPADDVAAYDGNILTLAGVSLDLSNNIQQLNIDLLTGDNRLDLQGTNSGDIHTISPTSNQYDSVIDTLILGASGPRSISLFSTQAITILGGTAATLNVNGTLADNTFAQTDDTIRVDSGPVITYTGVPVINVNGSGGFDQVYYKTGSPDYTFDASGLVPTLTNGTITVFYDRIEGVDLQAGDPTLTVIGTSNDDSYYVTLTGTNEASLRVQLNYLLLRAFRFNGYTLRGGGGGVDTVSIKGTNIADNATYDGNVAVVNGLSVNVQSNIDHLAIDLFSGLANRLTLLGSAGNDRFSVYPVTSNDAAFVDLNIAGATGPRTIDVVGIQGITTTSNGGNDTLEMWGTLGNNTYSMNDSTVRVDSGPVVTYTSVTNIVLAGLGAVDDVVYTGANAAYQLDASGANPVLTTAGVSTTMIDVELFRLVGTAAVNTFTVIGTAANETFNVSLTGQAKALMTTQLGGLGVTSETFSNYVTNGGPGGQDVTVINGTSGTDTVTSTGTVVTINGATVDVGTAIDRVELYTFAGADSIALNLSTAGQVLWMDSGADNDTIDNTGTSIPTSVFGGLGDDTITGGSNADYIDAGSGNDSIRSLGGVDTIYGGDGNDTALGGVGNDQFFGGDGSDTFIWNPGDNNDLVEGQGGQNVLIFNGADGVNDTFVMSAAGTGATGTGTRLRFDRQPGNVIIDAAGIQQVNANAGSGNDTVTINNLHDTEVKLIQVTLGALATPFVPDGVRDTITINGRQSSNEMALTVQQVPGQAAGVTQVDIEGLAQHIFLGGTIAACPVTPTDDVLTINGGIGNDHIVAAQGVELKIGMTINGGDGQDYVRANAQINGGAGDDTLLGAGGDCDLFITGGTGNDLICGNEGGDDTLLGNEGNDSIYGLGGNDSILGGTGHDFLAGNAGTDTIAGEAGNDTILGGAGSDTLDGNAGHDLILGDADADCGFTTVYLLEEGQGNDTINGGTGNDTLNGDLGNDLIFGNEGDDKLGPVDIYISAVLPVVVTLNSPTAPFTAQIGHFTDGGNDTMDGGSGNDTISGDTGDDSLIGNTGNDLIYGDPGNDTIFGNEGDDTIFGGDGNDTIQGNDGNDSISGGNGEDTIQGNLGNDTINGDAGEDLINGNEGDDSINGGDDNDTLFGDEGDDTIYGGNGDDTIQGNDGNDWISGDAGQDTIEGNLGDDTIYGGDGDDLINGNEDNDWISGGEGNDTAFGDDGDDTINGDAGDDSLIGNDGNDLISGNDGNDSLCGNFGDDTLICGAGDDVANGDEGFDSITGGDGADQLWGGDDNDTIFGNAGADTIVGGEGNDSIRAGTDDDMVFGNGGNDTVYGGFGNDAIYGDAGNDVLVGGDIKSVIHSHRRHLPSDGDDLVFGGDGNDWTDGGNGNNLLNSGRGRSETLIAGNGNDIALANTNPTTRFVIDLNGGHNLVVHFDFNKQPEIPFQECNRVTFGPPIIPVVHGHILQPGRVPGVPDTNTRSTRATRPSANLARALAARGPQGTTPLLATGPGSVWNQVVARRLATRVAK